MTDNKKAIYFMLSASLLFAVMNIIVKYIQTGPLQVPVAQVVFMRSFVMLLMVTAVLKQRKVSALGKNRRLLILRGLFGTVGIALFFYTLRMMPLASAVVVHYLTPIFTVLMSVVLTRTNIRPLQWLFFIICFAGVLVVKGFDTRVDTLALVLGVLGTIGAASAYNIISILKRTEHYLTIMFYFPVVTIPLVLIYIGFTGEWVWTNGEGWLLLSAIGVLTYLAQYFLTKAYQIGEVNKVSVVSYLGIIYALAFGFYLFDEWYSPIVLVGIALVVFGVVGNILYRK